MKKVFLLLVIGLMAIIPLKVSAQEKDNVTIYFFRGQTCEHCEEALNYINTYKDKLGDLNFVTYEVWRNQNNAALQQAVAKKLNVPEKEQGSVPFIVIGDQYIIGMFPTENDYNEILDIAKAYQTNGEYKDVVKETLTELNVSVSPKSLDQIFAKANPVVNIVIFSIFGIVILGFIGMVAFSRKK